MTNDDSLNLFIPSQLTESKTSSVTIEFNAFIRLSSHSSLNFVKYSNSLLYKVSSPQILLLSSTNSFRVLMGNLKTLSMFMCCGSKVMFPPLSVAKRLKLCSATIFKSSSILVNFFKMSLMSSDCCCVANADVDDGTTALDDEDEGSCLVLFGSKLGGMSRISENYTDCQRTIYLPESKLCSSS